MLDANLTQNSQITMTGKVVTVADCNNDDICPATQTSPIEETAEPVEQCYTTQVESKVYVANTSQSSTTDIGEPREQCTPAQVEATIDASVKLAQSSTTDTALPREQCAPTQVEATVDASINVPQSSTTDTAVPRQQCIPTEVESKCSSEDAACCIKTPVSFFTI